MSCTCESLLLAALVMPSATQDQLRSQPVVGVERTSTFELSIELTSPGATASITCRHPERGTTYEDREGGDRYSLHERIVITDEPLDVVDGRPLRFRRSYDEVTGTSTVPGHLVEPAVGPLEVKSELTDRSVVFRWNEEEQKYVPRFAKEDQVAPDALLEGLHGDMTLAPLLPNRTVEKGEEWSVAPEEFLHVLFPGGHLQVEGKREDHDEEAWSRVGGICVIPPLPTEFSRWASSAEGEVRAKHEGRITKDGSELFHVTVSFRIDASQDLIEWNRTMLGRWWEIMPFERAAMSWTLAGKAELLWNPVSGGFESLHLEGDLSVTHDLEWRFSWDNPTPCVFTHVMKETRRGRLHLEAYAGGPRLEPPRRR